MRHAALLLAVALVCAVPARADGPDRLSLLLGSYHIDPARSFEETNPGLFLTWEDAAALGPFGLDASLGVFRNSYGRAALAAVLAAPVYERGPVAVAVFLGAAYYPEDGRNFRAHLGDIVPLGGLQARIGPVFVQAIPGDGAEADAVLAAGVTLPLGRR